jgi:M6 family metalloprotease-like protein
MTLKVFFDVLAMGANVVSRADPPGVTVKDGDLRVGRENGGHLAAMTKEALNSKFAVALLTTLFCWNSSAGPPTRLGIKEVPPPGAIARTLQTKKAISRIESNKLMYLWGAESAPLGTRVGSIGTMRLLVVLVRTENAVVPFSREYVQQFFFGNLVTPNTQMPTNASVRDYYRAASGNRLVIEGEVLDWLTLTNRAEYWSSSGDPMFITGIAEHASRSVRLGQFDNDSLTGVGGSTQNDGYVDFLAIIYVAAPGEAAPGGYRFKYSMLNGTNEKEWQPSSPTADPTGVEDFILLPWADLGSDYSIGVVCHEIGHFLGLPDLYRRNVQYPTDIGHWCLMCWGCCRVGSLGSPFFGSSKFPPIFSAWCRDFLGWGQRSLLNRDGVAAVGSARTGSYLEVTQLDDPDERLLIEFYTPPTAISPWGKDLLPTTNTGFLVWHVDNRVGSGIDSKYFLWPSTGEGSGQNDFFFDPAIMSDPGGLSSPTGRPLVRLIPGDGRLDLENINHMLADSDDLFLTKRTTFKEAAKGLTLYRSHSDLQLGFDVTNRTVTRSTGQVPTAPGFGTTLSAAHPNSRPLANPTSTALLHEISDDPDLLNISEVRAKFASVPESEVCEFCVKRSDPIMFMKHQELRTFPLNSVNFLEERVAVASIKAGRFATGTTGSFVVGEYRTNVQRIEKLRIPVKGSNQMEDAKSRLSAVKSLWDLSSNSIEIVLGEKPTSTDNPNATSEVGFRVFGRVGTTNMPLAFVRGAMTYSNGLWLEGIEINRQVSVRELPSENRPFISTNAAIEVTKRLLGKDVPPTTSYTAEMELFPAGSAKDQWKLAFKVGVHIPGANPIFSFVDAQSGNLLPNGP